MNGGVMLIVDRPKRAVITHLCGCDTDEAPHCRHSTRVKDLNPFPGRAIASGDNVIEPCDCECHEASDVV